MRDPLSVLCVAEQSAKSILGSSTACFITLDGEELHYANLGDSGFLVVRNKKLFFRSEG